ncbi:MAG TPA: HEAT repeat domain-containing protein, partial [Gemmataceae bacterium]|nr:HEAT repeat domain-containing protein [Gemmataceae bacterium]
WAMASATDLGRWEDVPHGERVRRTIAAGRESITKPAVAAQLREWRSGDFTARFLAVFACHGSRDSATLLELCGDPSRTISGTALKAITHVGDDESILTALRAAPPKRLARLLARLRRRRQGVVDRYLGERIAAGEEAATLIPLGSAAFADRHFALGDERGGDKFWRRLAANHPARAAAALVAKLDAIAAPDGLLFAYARTAITHLAARHSDLSLRVVTALHRHQALASIPLQPLVNPRAVEVAEMVLASSEAATVCFERVVTKLGVPRVISLFRRAPSWLGTPAEWLKRFPAADRAALYRELSPAWTLPDGRVGSDIVRVLPTELRVAEARRILPLPVLAANPHERLIYSAFLPWDEARELGKPWLGHPEAEFRQRALVALCEVTRFDRDRLPDLLELLAARMHEQDPVRQAFFTAIAALPPGRWTAAHLSGLAQLVRDALDAGDLSGSTVAQIGLLVNRILPHHPTWAVEQLALVSAERGSVPLGGVLYTAEQVRQMRPLLTPVMRGWSKREREHSILALATGVERRLTEWPELAEALEEIVRKSPNSWSAAHAMNLLLEHLPRERERRVTTTLAKDESWILQPKVLDFVNRRRQDLLTPFLGQRTYSGRFSTGRTRHVLPVTSGFHRWTTTQQNTFAGTLGDLTTPPRRKADEQPVYEVQNGVRRLALLPGVAPDRLIKLASDKRPAVRETAVRALGRLDARQGIPELLVALGDDRARWAVYALRAALCDLPPARVLDVMRTVPLGKVTVAKEALRLAGEFGGVACLGWFTELDKQKLHRDVRGALLRALWDHLERPEAWAILDSSAGSTDTGVVIGLARIQVDRASNAARERVVGLLLRLLDHPEPTVRVAVLNRFAQMPVPDPRRELLKAALAKLVSQIPDERAAALTSALSSATAADVPAFEA